MYTVKRGWREVTDGPIYDLFMEVIEEAMNIDLIPSTTKELPRLFIHKSVRALGTCYNHRNPDGSYSTSILLSEYILDCPKEKVRKTIVHEIGHMLAPGDKHGYYWYAKTNRLGRKWGYTASRLEHDEEMNNAMNAARKAANEVAYKYELVCPKCGAVCGRYKHMCKAVQYPQQWRHSKCGTALIAREIH